MVYKGYVSAFAVLACGGSLNGKMMQCGLWKDFLGPNGH